MVESSYLAHHGIKGMKWGVRRYQNPDGSLTSAGKARQRMLDERQNYSNKVKKNGAYAYTSSGARHRLSVEKATADFKDEKIKEKLAKQSKKSARQLKLEQRYMDKGLTKEEAAIRAYKQRRAEKFMTAAAVTALAAGAAYGGYKLYQDRADKFIKQGTTLSRVTKDSGFDVHDMFYASDKKRDDPKYQGMYAKNIEARYGGAYLKKLDVTDNIKGASPKHARDTFKELVEKDPQFKQNVQNAVQNTADNKWARAFLGEKQNKAIDAGLSDLKKGKASKKAYEAYNFIINNRGNADNDAARGKFTAALKAKGYGAIQDVNDKKLSGYKAKNPLIVFDKDKVKVDKVSKLDSQTIKNLDSKEVAKLSRQIAIKNGLKESVKNPWNATMLGIAAASYGAGAYKKAATKKQNDNIVQQYRKQNPNSKKSYNEIVEEERKKKVKR